MIRILLRVALMILSMVGIWTGTERAEAALDAQVVTVGGEVRERYEFRDNADFNSNASDTLSFVGSRIRLHLGYEVTPDIAFFLQMQDSRLFGSETSTASNEKNLDLHQGYLTVKNLAGPLTMTLGRQEMVFGDSRLVGNFGWSNIARSFDGIKLGYSTARARTDVWVATVKKFANLDPDPAFTSSNRKEQTFFGIYHGWSGIPGMMWEPYAMFLWDTGSGGSITDPAARDQRRVTLGLRVASQALAESADYTAEGAYQFGGIQGRDIRAYAFAVKAGYTLPVALKPRIGIEYDRASGDDNSSDDKFETFENLFPTNHIHYGYMDYVGWRNMQDLRFSLGVKPTKVSSISVDYHWFWLAEKRDNWYRASGHIFRTTPTTGNTKAELGQEINLVAYTMIKEKLRLEAGYGRFFPGDYVKVNFPSATDDSDFLYLQAMVNF